ncbi:SDR family NAD(P)-dependent oxidoreductase [Saccharothrix sp. AJ9571]|nr:SDR family NAD(P)-dependent oxidoreductase [Saccharothrix sp. AJ9571]
MTDRIDNALDCWRHRMDWRPVSGTPRLSGRWAVVVADLDDGAQFAAVLRQYGAEPILIPAGNRSAMADCLRIFRELNGVISLLALQESDEDLPPGVASTVYLMQALGDAGLAVPLWCVTRGAMTTGGDPVQALLWGLGRAAVLENPHRWGGIVDLPGDLDDHTARHFVTALSHHGGDNRFAVHKDGLYAARTVREPGHDWTPRGTVLITGATGALGTRVARWAAEQGADHLVLVSRRGPAAAEAAELRKLLAGTRVTMAAADVTDEASLARVKAECGPIDAVVHTAGHDPVGPLPELRPADLLARVIGARNLDRVFAETTLDAFVLMSTLDGVRGRLGQGAAAATSAYLAALAARRRARGGRAHALAYDCRATDDLRIFVFPDELDNPGLAHVLRERSAEFAATYAECERQLARYTDPLHGHDWATMVALAAMWRARGVRPARVLGHGAGEIAAAVVSGSLTLEEGAKAIAVRSQEMVAVSLPESEVADRIARWQGRIGVLAVEGPESVVVSGDPAAIDELTFRFRAGRITVRRLVRASAGNAEAFERTLTAYRAHGYRLIEMTTPPVPAEDRVHWLEVG